MSFVTGSYKVSGYFISILQAKLLCLQHKCETASSEQLQTIDRKHNEVQISNRKYVLLATSMM